MHVETNANEAGAAAMLGASINYPMRGAVTFKSTVGTNVASDALSNLASAGVKGGTLLVLGEDYGEGASIIQERTHAFAMKSQIWLLDPRPTCRRSCAMVEQALRALGSHQHPGDARAAHPRLPRAPARSSPRRTGKPVLEEEPVPEAPASDYGRISPCRPPTYAQEKHKIDVRWPAAVRFLIGE